MGRRNRGSNEVPGFGKVEPFKEPFNTPKIEDQKELFEGLGQEKLDQLPEETKPLEIHEVPGKERSRFNQSNKSK